MKNIHKAPNHDAAALALNELEKKWAHKYKL
jgi:hypothetical protein